MSDIHANFEALRAIKPFVDEADVSINLGDTIGYSCGVNECIEFLRENNIISIQGNHDRYLIEGMECQTKFLNDSVRFGIDFANKVITNDNFNWLNRLPLTQTYKFDDVTISCNHGSPFDTINQYVYENNTDFSEWNSFNYDFIAIGHTHRELLHSIRNGVVINPGSIGQARDFEGYACFSFIDTQKKIVERKRVKYDWEKNLEYSKSMGGSSDWLYKHYQTLIQK